MPLDPRIILGGQAPQVPVQSPMEALSSIAQLQGIREQTEARRLAADTARQKAADEAAVRRVLTETGGDIEQALPRLRQIAPKAALEFETEIGKARKEKADALTKEFDYRGKQIDLGLRIGNSVHDDASLRVATPSLLAIAPQLKPLIPETYDPNTWQSFLDIGLTAKEKHETRDAGLKAFLGGDPRTGLATILSTAGNAQEWQNGLDGAKAVGAPAELIAQFGEYSPANVARAAQLGITPEKRAELAGQAETRAETAKRDAASAAVAAGNLAVAQGHLGVARGQLGVAQAREAREGKAVGAGAVKLTAAQQDDLATMMTVQQLANDAGTLGTQTKWEGVGPLQGRIGGTPLGYGGTQGETLRNKIGNIQATIAKLRGGTSFTPNEQALLETYTPTVTDPEQKIQAKLASLADFIEKKRQNTLRVASGDYNIPAAAAGGGGATTATTVTTGAPKKNPFLK